MPFIGTGGLGERVWSGPAMTVTGIDALPVDKAVNAVVPYARAKLEPPHPPGAGSRPRRRRRWSRHLEGLRPFGIALEVEAAETGKGFAASDHRAGVRGRARRARRAPGAARR